MADAGDGQAFERPADPPWADPLWDDWESPPRVPAIPEFHLAGFDGPLDLLLDLAERARIDLGGISVGEMVDQFVAALVRAERHVPLDRRADWLAVMARLLLLRSRLVVPTSPAAENAAWEEAERERARLRHWQFVRAASAWLEARPRLGHDVFVRPRRVQDPRTASYLRLMEACLATLEREEAGEPPAIQQVYVPVTRALFRIPDALRRMRALLETLDAPVRLTGFLPRMAASAADRELVARSAVASTFVASLELTRTAELVLGDGDSFAAVTGGPPTRGAAGEEAEPAQ